MDMVIIPNYCLLFFPGNFFSVYLKVFCAISNWVMCVTSSPESSFSSPNVGSSMVLKICISIPFVVALGSFKSLQMWVKSGYIVITFLKSSLCVMSFVGNAALTCSPRCLRLYHSLYSIFLLSIRCGCRLSFSVFIMSGVDVDNGATICMSSSDYFLPCYFPLMWSPRMSSCDFGAMSSYRTAPWYDIYVSSFYDAFE